MCVPVTLRGQLGNNHLQYALGRIIAEQCDLALECSSLVQHHKRLVRYLDLRGPSTLAQLHLYFPRAPLTIPGKTVNEPIEAYELGPHSGWEGQSFDLARVLA